MHLLLVFFFLECLQALRPPLIFLSRTKEKKRLPRFLAKMLFFNIRIFWTNLSTVYFLSFDPLSKCWDNLDLWIISNLFRSVFLSLEPCLFLRICHVKKMRNCQQLNYISITFSKIWVDFKTIRCWITCQIRVTRKIKSGNIMITKPSEGFSWKFESYKCKR